MGMPIYGRSFDATSLPVGGSYSGVGSGSWENGVWDYKALPRSGATEYYNAETGASYSYDTGAREFISYDTVDVVKGKAGYIAQKGLGGSMFWEASADKSGGDSLIGAAAGALGGLDSGVNCLSYPDSQFANIVAGMPGE
jgi:chitinase